MRGRVLAVAEASAPGLVAGDDGRRYAYGLTDLCSAAPHAGEAVDFQVEPGSGDSARPIGTARDLYLIPGVVPAFPEAPTHPVALHGAARPDWTRFYLSPNGRVALGDYWLYGFLVLFAVNLLLGWIPVFGQIASLVAAWAGIALATKRCHDVNRSGWWSWLPIVPLVAGLAAVPLALSNAGDAAVAVVVVCSLLALIAGAWLFFAVLIRQGDPGDNRFGPPPPRIKP
ncbi:hypothetical protein AFCDBAGC_3136 [Methylobacterium cerastii]|uniref:DUF805 domain-containing protein n=1 Tax=Methylobacterium cerastii TaxID=932741 RepID=A0ABQ4QKD0_9HYPH|nr:MULTISPECIES: DUF805 domain-containing protein [Methylobacterium]TXN10654.1 DUF805 domain-containing protein [Methylobacterium sp. WL122]TXN76631.1 DUF805 domain-containing protein [Methylobacterium sp. WL8]GJD45265.1 hypothetical protein AFCDBAGC_3136 [Methylobacterium cerastii]